MARRLNALRLVGWRLHGAQNAYPTDRPPPCTRAKSPHITRMTNLPAPLAPSLPAEIAVLAKRHARAHGPLMRAITKLGGSFESGLAALPDSIRSALTATVESALSTAYGLAATTDRIAQPSRRATTVMALASGAAGGAGGMVTSLAEMPVTITLILQAIRAEARAAGLNPDADDVRAASLRVLASGGPLADDDGIDTAFLSARMTLTGPALQKLVATIAPRLAATLGQKLAATAVPVIGAASGAAINAAFLRYFREMAAVQFALLRLSQQHGADRVMAEFRAAATPPKLTKAKG